MDDAVKWAQIVGTVAVVATFVVYWRQLVAMQAQVTAAREASRTQNLLSLIDYIQRPEHRQARRHLFALDRSGKSDWFPDSEDQRQAELACSAWDTVGLLLRRTTIPDATQMIVDNWRHSIWRSHTLTTALRDRLRVEREPNFWNDFDWLASQALEGYKVQGTSLVRAGEGDA
mgnify:CR=1 FL=1